MIDENKPAEGGAVVDSIEATYATAKRLAKRSTTVKCDFCSARPGELHAFDCVALDEKPAPAGSGEAVVRHTEGVVFALDGLDGPKRSSTRHFYGAKSHCATCTCNPGMTPSIRFDTSPAQKEGVVRDHLIRLGWTPPADATQVEGGAADDLLHAAKHALAALRANPDSPMTASESLLSRAIAKFTGAQP